MIYGDRLRLRAVERSDLELFVEWLNDPEVREGLLLHLPMSMAEEEKWFEDMIKRPDVEHPMVIEIRQDESWVMIGNCGIHNIAWRLRSAEVGIFIGEKGYWDQGYGTEAMRLLLDHSFNTLNLNRITLQVYEDNPRAVRAYEKVGFVHEGRARQGMYKNGRYVDIIWMSVLRSEW
ncbi:GNAT family N-acetyltransferase [Chloroflexota bacterium]